MSQPTSAQSSAPPQNQSIPFWRNVRVLAILGQLVFLLLVALGVGIIINNVASGMERLGMPPINYDFMSSEAGFEIAQTFLPYGPTDSFWRAFAVGLVNTLVVSIAGIILATLLGIFLGIAQLSSNWLIARLARLIVIIFRNIPLLLQLLFWYFAVFQKLPPVREAIAFPGPIYLSQRGVTMIGPAFGPTVGVWLLFVLGGLLVGGVAWTWLMRYQERTGKERPRYLIAGAILVAFAVVGWFVLTPSPVTLTTPELGRFNFSGGLSISPEFAALLLSLTVYTGVFIAENVRAGIQGVSKGQKEAARALGLTGSQSMRLVILPQALRIIIPPTTNQYLNLAKNSSLAIAIGFADLFNVSRTILNVTGQTIPLILLLMVTYLAISLSTSLIMNIYNRRVRLVER